jgi:hypothetical protein
VLSRIVEIAAAYFSGAGGLVSTAEDYAQFATVHRAAGRDGDDHPDADLDASAAARLRVAVFQAITRQSAGS